MHLPQVVAGDPFNSAPDDPELMSKEVRARIEAGKCCCCYGSVLWVDAWVKTKVLDMLACISNQELMSKEVRARIEAGEYTPVKTELMWVERLGRMGHNMAVLCVCVRGCQQCQLCC